LPQHIRRWQLFFGALSYVITGSESYKRKIRERICDHLVQNSAILSSNLDPRYVDVLNYLQLSKMRNSRVWSTEVEIFAAASLFQTCIFVYTRHGTEWKWLEHVPMQKESTRSVYLYHRWGNHYDVVTSIQQNSVCITSLPVGMQSYFKDQVKRDKQLQKNALQRKKYASTPDIRQKKKNYAKKRYNENKSLRKQKKETSKFHQRLKYSCDKTFKEGKKLKEKEYQKRKYTSDVTFRDAKNMKAKVKYHTDRKFRDRKIEKERNRYKMDQKSQETQTFLSSWMYK